MIPCIINIYEKMSLKYLINNLLVLEMSVAVLQKVFFFRNLFFRTAYLVLADIDPVFVLEGDAPELKRDVMAVRNQIQFRGAAPRSESNGTSKKPDVARKRFKNVLKEVSIVKTF